MFTMLIGEVDEVPGTGGEVQSHKISTRFVSFVGPFESLCVTFENFEHLGGRTTRHSWSGEKVRLNVWSILLGYLRVWLAIGILVLPFALYWGQRVEGYMFVPSGYSLIGLGLLSLRCSPLPHEGRLRVAGAAHRAALRQLSLPPPP